MLSSRTALIVALVLQMACARSPSIEPGDSGIEGVVLLGPTCPVETPESPCPHRPIEAELTVIGDGSDNVVRLGSSGPDGRFRVSVGPGDYTLSATASGAMSCDPQDVTVEGGRFTEVTVQCDTGIR